jgi:hypothetical protein
LKFISEAVSLIVEGEQGTVMKRTLVAALATAFVATSAFAIAAEDNQQPSRAERMQHWRRIARRCWTPSSPV